jgi:5-formyltetrahydrofolate cyclo-ligase
MTKSELRKICLARQKALSPAERKTKSLAIADLFFQKTDLSNVRFLHCFIAIQKFNEIDTSIIFERLWVEHPKITTVVPRIVFATGEMENLVFSPETETVQNAWNIHEPTHNEYVLTREIDIVLIPGLAFDRNGHRVGYGKGFYDRFLAKCRPDCLKIGLSYFAPVEKISDAWDGDIKLDQLITTEG